MRVPDFYGRQDGFTATLVVTDPYGRRILLVA